jgi:MFS family permease
MASLSFGVLRKRNFNLLLFTRTCVMTALQAQAVIVGWQVYSLTHSPFLLGMTGLAEALPAIVCSLFSGHIVDTQPPRRIYMTALAVLFFNTAVLLGIAGGYTGAAQNTVLLALFAGTAISGFARSFIMPAYFSLIPLVVRRDEYSAAAAWQGTMQQVALVCGPALGGLIYGGYGAHGAWMFPVLMMAMATALGYGIHVRHEPKKHEGSRPSAVTSILEGWRFLFTNKALLSLMALDMLAVLFGGAIAILPAFADQVLQIGAEGLGVLRAAPALGAVVTALYFALRPMKIITARRMLVVVGGFGVAMIGFGLSTHFASALVFLILSGAFDSVSVIIRGTMMQVLTPEDMKGRVSAVNAMFIISSNELGAFESGMAAALLGLVPSIVAGGAVTLLVVGATALLSPGFRRLRMDV